jgi:hypothetical protein
MTANRRRVYLLRGCPFSMRFHVFLTEAGLADIVDIVVVQARHDAHKSLFANLEAAGLRSGFPIVERWPGKFETDSQTMIDHMAEEHAIDSTSLPLLKFYTEGMLPRYGQMLMELKRLKGTDWNGEL